MQNRASQGTVLESTASPDGSRTTSDKDVEVVKRNVAGSSTGTMTNENAPADVMLNVETPAKDSNVQQSIDIPFLLGIGLGVLLRNSNLQQRNQPSPIPNISRGGQGGGRRRK